MTARGGRSAAPLPFLSTVPDTILAIYAYSGARRLWRREPGMPDDVSAHQRPRRPGRGLALAGAVGRAPGGGPHDPAQPLAHGSHELAAVLHRERLRQE